MIEPFKWKHMPLVSHEKYSCILYACKHVKCHPIGSFILYQKKSKQTICVSAQSNLMLPPTVYGIQTTEITGKCKCFVCYEPLTWFAMKKNITTSLISLPQGCCTQWQIQCSSGKESFYHNIW